jgi:enoyl-CoA hydratase
MSFENLIVEKKGAVGVVTFNRPKALNALNGALTSELKQALDDLETDGSVAVIVLTGSERAFAAGADIKEMKEKTFADVYMNEFITRDWERLRDGADVRHRHRRRHGEVRPA